MEWIGLWWRQSSHYDELSAHLQARGLAPLGRITVSVTVAGMAIVALGTIWTPIGPRGPLPVACTVVASAAATAGALLWVLRLPSRTESVWFVVVCNAAIGLAALAQHDPMAAMLCSTAFATLASYIALFHVPPLMAYNFAIASVIGGVEAVRIAAKYNIAAAVAAYSMLLLLNWTVPFGIQVLAHVLGADAIQAERDQLTGLLTRRAFHRRAKALLEQGGQQLAYVVITVIDLDRFKQLNDSYGHSTGDDALVSVSRALRDANDDTAVIGRSGGEEFVIADIWEPVEVNPRAQQLCEVVAALPFGITASIGTAGIHPAYRTGKRSELLIELIAAADAAMYAAKRRGGNRARHHEWPRVPLFDPADDKPDHYSNGITA